MKRKESSIDRPGIQPPKEPPTVPDKGPSAPVPADPKPGKGPVEVPEPPGEDIHDPPTPEEIPPVKGRSITTVR